RPIGSSGAGPHRGHYRRLSAGHARHCRTGGPSLMLDFNHRPTTAEAINERIDTVLEADHAVTPPRDYLGGSRLGHACERALQFEFMKAPKDAGAGFSGRTLRIFAIGHQLEDLAVAWLRRAGFEL